MPDAVRASTSASVMRRNGPSRLVEDARCRARDDQSIGTERRRQVRGKRVGVDVQQRAVGRRADARDDRYVAGPEQVLDERDVACRRLADESEIDDLAGLRPDRRAATLQTELRIGAREADRLAAGRVDRGDQLRCWCGPRAR